MNKALRSSPVNPDFRRDEVQHKTNPKGGPEKLIGSQAGKAAGREENADDRPDGGNRQTD